MFATAVIVFRETLEAALIVSIVLAATRGVAGRRRWIGAGVAAGIAGALVIAGLTEVIAGALQGIGQELFNASILIAAVAMLAWIASGWPWIAASSPPGCGVEPFGTRRPSDACRAVGAVTLAVLREGAETVLFIQGVATSEPLHSVMAGLALGVTGGAALGALLYLGLVHIPVRHFFRGHRLDDRGAGRGAGRAGGAFPRTSQRVAADRARAMGYIADPVGGKPPVRVAARSRRLRHRRLPAFSSRATSPLPWGWSSPRAGAAR